ncbi:hypothetical protein RFI_01913 [Reticulomyxa filosa]|uniref:Uncharacterized protein n=1 Tax=Reticulomyxa filosa TaxID=46433 RepID=X6PAH5_RETFI|nr:hypothetical protein RFI_01913 [Reticulomyxa filosa]|eukprot:ETO35161.1 hypothetical protein RFI_01913 [Reticulomyxa filosa]
MERSQRPFKGFGRKVSKDETSIEKIQSTKNSEDVSKMCMFFLSMCVGEEAIMKLKYLQSKVQQRKRPKRKKFSYGKERDETSNESDKDSSWHYSSHASLSDEETVFPNEVDMLPVANDPNLQVVSSKWIDVWKCMNQIQQLPPQQEMHEIARLLAKCITEDIKNIIEYVSGHPVIIDCYLFLCFAFTKLNQFDKAKEYIELLKTQHHMLPATKLKVLDVLRCINLRLRCREKAFENLKLTTIEHHKKLITLFDIEMMEILENWDDVEPPPIEQIRSGIQEIIVLYGKSDPSLWSLAYFFEQQYFYTEKLEC